MVQALNMSLELSGCRQPGPTGHVSRAREPQCCSEGRREPLRAPEKSGAVEGLVCWPSRRGIRETPRRAGPREAL